MIRKGPAPHPGKMLVTFELPGWTGREQVHLVGDFNSPNQSFHPSICKRPPALKCGAVKAGIENKGV